MMKKLLFILCFLVLLTGCQEINETKGNEKETQNKETEKENDFSLDVSKYVETRNNGVYKYNVYEDCVEIVNYFGDEEELEVPEEIDGLKIRSIISLCDKRTGMSDTKIKKVKLPDGIVNIGYNCLYVDFGKVFPDTLENISIPDTVEVVGPNVFTNTEWYKGLNEEYVIIGDGVLIKCNSGDKKEIVYPQNVRCMSAESWEYLGINESKEKIVIPEGCEEIILDNVECKDVKDIVVPNSLKRVTTNAFSHMSFVNESEEDFLVVGDGILVKCSENEKLIIPNEVKYIATYIEIKNKNIEYPVGLVGAGRFSFSFMTNYDGAVDVILGENNNICKSMYESNTASSMVIPEKTEIIEAKAFQGMRYVEKIELPNSVKYIGAGAFDGCSKLTNITIPSNIMYIGDAAFSCCTSLENVTISEGVKYIGDTAFWNTQIDSIYIPESVTYIGEDALKTKGEVKREYNEKMEYYVEKTYFNYVSEIKGVKGSYAEQYAKEHDIKFVEIQ